MKNPARTTRVIPRSSAADNKIDTCSCVSGDYIEMIVRGRWVGIHT